MPWKNPEMRRARDRERVARRTAERRAAGLCPKCGKRRPEPDRSICEPCAVRSRAVDRVRDARLRAAGKPRRDPVRAKACERERARRQADRRREAGLCLKCGQQPAEPARRLCEWCAKKRREAERIRYARARSAGLKYGGKNVQAKRRSARVASRKRRQIRLDAGMCIRCGCRPPADTGTTCEPCREVRQTAERELYASRRAARLCTVCGGPASDGGSRCAPCSALEAERGSPERKNAASRRRYWNRRAARRCTHCGAPSHGAARCETCARRSYERSGHVRGMPVYPPSFAVILITTEECLGTFDDEMEAAAFIAFEKLSGDQVVVIRDVHPLATLAGWE